MSEWKDVIPGQQTATQKQEPVNTGSGEWVDVDVPAEEPYSTGQSKNDPRFGALGMPTSLDAYKDVASGISNAYKGEGGLMGPTKSVIQGAGDMALGAGAGTNQFMADVINYFDGDENAVADWLQQGAADLRAKQSHQDGAAAAVGEELGTMAVTAPIGGAIGKLFGKGYDAANKAIRTNTGRKSLRYLDDVKSKADRALVTDEADDVFRTSFPKEKLVPGKGAVPNYRSELSIVNKGKPVPGAKIDDLPATKRILENSQSSLSAAPGSPVVKATERLLNSKIPVLSDVSDFVGKYVNRLAAAGSKTSAAKVRESFIKEAVDNGYSRGQGLEMFESYVLKTSNAGNKLVRPGSAIGTLMGSQANN